MEHKWRKLKENIVFKGKQIGKVYNDDVIFPNGKKGKFEYIKKPPFIAVIAKTDKNKIILVGQYRYTEKKFSWEIPEGGIDKGEAPLQAAKRELEEEAGLKAKQWKKIGQFVLGAGSFHQICHVYLAQKLYLGKQEPEVGGEILEVKEVSLNQLNNKIKQGKIFEGPMLAALYLAKDYLKK